LIEVEVKGGKAAEIFFSRAQEKLDKAAKETIEEIAKKIETAAKQFVPVRTGYLRSTIYSEPIDEFNIHVGASAPYSGFVEYGTSHMAAKPFLRPALAQYDMEMLPLLAQRVMQYLRELIQELESIADYAEVLK
jgi:HK97 gp10 family phage protein